MYTNIFERKHSTIRQVLDKLLHHDSKSKTVLASLKKGLEEQNKARKAVSRAVGKWKSKRGDHFVCEFFDDVWNNFGLGLIWKFLW